MITCLLKTRYRIEGVRGEAGPQRQPPDPKDKQNHFGTLQMYCQRRREDQQQPLCRWSLWYVPSCQMVLATIHFRHNFSRKLGSVNQTSVCTYLQLRCEGWRAVDYFAEFLGNNKYLLAPLLKLIVTWRNLFCTTGPLNSIMYILYSDVNILCFRSAILCSNKSKSVHSERQRLFSTLQRQRRICTFHYLVQGVE